MANVVDHIVAHKGDAALFWNRSNWQPMSDRCNSRKAVREEGGFGRPISGEKSRKVYDSSARASGPRLY